MRVTNYKEKQNFLVSYSLFMFSYYEFANTIYVYIQLFVQYWDLEWVVTWTEKIMFFLIY